MQLACSLSVSKPIKASKGRMDIILVLALIFGGISMCQKAEGANLYPFGTPEGDEVIPKQKDYGVELTGRDSFEFPFLGREPGYLYIANNGYIAFDEGGRAFKSTKNWNNPNPKWPTEPDPSFLAPYYAENHLTSTDAAEPGSIFYRVLKDPSLLVEITKELKMNMVTARNFIPSQGLIVTWFNLTFSGHFCVGQSGCPPRNTFQAILLTDKKDSYVIFKYAQLMWLGGPSYGGDTATGLGAQFFPQAGFNKGDGLGWYPIPKSGTEDILDLVKVESSDEETGSFYYKVSGDDVVPGGCQEGSDRLVRFPEHGSMLGGQIVEMSGPCFKSSDRLQCKFDEEVVRGEFVSRTKVRCVQPMFMKIGVISLALSTDGGKRFSYQTSYTLVALGESSSAVTVGSDFDMSELVPAQMTLTWPIVEATTDPISVVDLKLFGYSHSLPTPIKELQVLKSGVNNTGQLTLNLAEYRCMNNLCLQYELGMVQVSESGKSKETKPRLWSYLIPLGWYVEKALQDKIGKNWPEQKCRAWTKQDKKSMEWLDDVQSCPCNVEQVVADFGRWRDWRSCNMHLGTPCRFHDDAVHCVNSNTPTKQYGAGNQCCYGKDGLLMYAADSFYGSTPDMAGGMGMKPYGKHPHIPRISHWILDVIPFFYCCLWNKGTCDLYMEQRPTRDCTAYTPPKQGSIYGLAHLFKFDGSESTFNGVGDFWLVKTDTGNQKDLMIQVKLERYPMRGKLTNATMMTAIAMRDGTSSTIEIRLRPDSRDYNRKLDIVVDGAKQYFDENWQQWQTFKNATIKRNEYVNITNSNFTIMFDSGVGVQVAAYEGLLHAIVSLPTTYKGQVNGLLGELADEEEMDYIFAIEGSFTDLNDTGDTIKSYVTSWGVTNDQTLFSKQRGKQSPSYSDGPFDSVRGDIPVSPGVIMEDIKALCQNNTPCIFDYTFTESSKIAENTKMAADWFLMLKRFSTIIPTCGLLKVRNSLKDNYNYSIGNKVRITGCRAGYQLKGQLDYDCVYVDGGKQWIPEKTAQCISLNSSGPRNHPRVLLCVLSIIVIAITSWTRN